MKLIRSKFESWLKSKPPTEIVGENRDCDSCPIATFYMAASGGCEVNISGRGDGNYTIARGYSKRALPAWASAFVSLVDGNDRGEISAGRALEIMRQIS
jgi:hypothetical protein